MNETYTDEYYNKDGTVPDTKRKIIDLLSRSNYSISETRGVFASIIEQLERFMPVTSDLTDDKKRIKSCGKYLELSPIKYLNIDGAIRKISLYFYDENGKRYTPGNIAIDIKIFDKNENELSLNYAEILNVDFSTSYISFKTNNTEASDKIVKVKISDMNDESVTVETQFLIKDFLD
ncbi:hypothetical protein [Clostridium sp. HBUAS56010]|uniref:hypothetical protein n=1 Tax=Clostridium sp. HBUAS56010 TaxID=2571127 RepID=UPI0011788411|nr:hypothetical protein [Clostridium sp. HBUAS56010]